MTNNYLKPIDGLRGLAILLVIMFHLGVAYFGWAGVILFFVLSGYLITKTLYTEKESPSPLKNKFRNFWARRVLRIFPLYYLYFFILSLILILKWIPSNPEMPWLFTYSYNFYLINVYDTKGPSFLTGHLWSLSIEEQFYLFYPFIVFLFKRNQMKIAVILIMAISILFRLFFSVYETENSSGYLDYHPLTYLDAFLFGAAVFIFKADKMKLSAVYSIFIFSALLTLLGGLYIYIGVNQGQHFSFTKYFSSFGIQAHYTKNLYRVWGLLQLNLFFSSLLLILLLPSNKGFHYWIKRIFEIKPLVAIGKMSYGMYIFHAIIIWLLLTIFNHENTGMNKYVFFILCLGVTWLVAFAVYHLYEKRFLMLKERFREPLTEDTGSPAISPAEKGYSMAVVTNSDVKK